MQQDLHYREGKETRAHIIHHNPDAVRKPFKLAHGWRLQCVERSKKYKAHEKRFPRDWRCRHGNQLSGNLVNHYELRIFEAGCPSYAGGGWNSNCDCDRGQCNGSGGLPIRNYPVAY